MKKLVIAEKPSVAMDYAKVLKCHNRNDGYVEGPDYVITWAYGHLFTLAEPEDYNSKYKNWSFDDLPIIPGHFKVKLIKSGIKQYKIIKNLILRDDVDLIINGGDAGREGELIQRYIINSTRTNKPVKRLWISSLTENEIRKGFNNLKPGSQYDNLYQSAKTRAEIDWLLGINYSRAYTTRNKGNKAIIIGRVQTAILNLIYEREKERSNFKPEPYKEIEAEFENYKGKYLNDDNYRIFDFDLANKIYKECQGAEGEIKEITKEKKNKYAPKLFNLTGLQKKMNKKHNFSSQKTLDIAQKLYEEYKILSYPRTDSHYLGNTHKKEINQILDIINFGEFNQYISLLNLDQLKFSNRFIDDSKITDHHAIIPTNNKNISTIYNKLSNDEKLLFDEVVKSLISQFYDPYTFESTKVTTSIKDKYLFESKGKVVLNKGWKYIYPDKKEDNIVSLPGDLKEGMIKKVTNIEIIDKKTEPPSLFDESDLLAQLEKYNIGTEATRAGIIEKLLSRKYILKDKKKLLTTAPGKKIIETIITDEIKDPELTGELERKLELIRTGEIKREELIKEEVKKLKLEIEKLHNTKIEVNKAEDKYIVKCPVCRDGQIVKYNNFFGCSNWNNPDNKCDFTINKIAGKMLTDNQVKELCENRETKTIKGFKSKSGNKFSAKLILNQENKIEFVFPEKKTDTIKISCPICKNGTVVDKGKFYGCSEYKKSGCNFTISKNYFNKNISINLVKELCEKGITQNVEGLKSKKGKTFSAKLRLKGNKMELEF